MHSSENRHLAKNRQRAVAVSISRPQKEMTPKPPPRHANQQGSVSAKVARVLELFRDDLESRYAERTVPEYLTHVGGFLLWLDRRGLELVEVRTDDVLAYQKDLASMRKRDGKLYSLGFQASRLNVVRVLCRFLCRRGYLLHDPAAGLHTPRQNRSLPHVILTLTEVLRMLGTVRGQAPSVLRDRAILETLYATGIRVAELGALKLTDVDTEERVLRVVRGKGGKDRNLPLTRAAAEAIEAYVVKGRAQLLGKQPRRELFVGERGARLHRAVVGRTIAHWARTAGIKKHVTCHTFRHTVATHLLKGRADIRHIQALLGHASLRTTEIYTRVEISNLKEVVRRAHPRGK